MSHGCYCYAKATTIGSRSRSSSSSSLVVAIRHPVEIKWTPPPPPTTTNPFPLMSMSSPEKRRHVAASVAFNPQGNYDLPLSLEDDDFDPANLNAPLPPTLGRFEVPIDTNIIRTLDLSPFQSATSISSDRWAEELMERTVGFSINYKRDDPHDTRELSEMPDVRLWFVRLDATYPWLPVVLDWRAGELARYAAMLVPHQMSLRMGVVFNPEALELFVIKKAFVVYSWLLLHGVPEPKARVKTTDMARMLGFGIGDDLFHLIHLHPLWLALCVATNSAAWLTTAALVTNMRNFPVSRGTGILKGYGGLSAAVYTEIYSVILNSSSVNLLLFLALGVPILCFLVMYLVRPCTPSSRENSAENSHFAFIQVASVLLGIYLLTTTVVGENVSLSRLVSYLILAVMIVLIMAPLMVPLKMTLFPTNPLMTGIYAQETGSSDSLIDGDNHEKTEPLLTPSSSGANVSSYHENEESSDIDLLLAEGEGAIKKKRRPKRGDDFTFKEAIVKADFWLLFSVYFVGVGSGVTVLNNLAQIGIALGVRDATVLLSIFSFFNFVGRLGGGSVSEYFVRTKTLPRTIWLTCTQVVMIIVYLLFASGLDGTLYVATGMLGLCYGVQFSIMIPTASELFGLKNFGIIYNFMSIGNPLGALLFSGLLAGYIYDHEASKQHGVSALLANSHTCYGPNCYRITFLVLACVCGVGSILSVVLTIRIKPVYQMLYSGGSFRQPSNSNN